MIAAVDIGGTAAKTALFTTDGRATAKAIHRLEHLRGRPEMVEEIVRVCAATVAAGRGEVEALGLLIPGIVDPVAKVGISSMLLGWRDVPFGELVEAACGVPVAVDHDVRTAARAEFYRWQPSEPSDALFVTVGTGIGAAALIAGSIRTGAHGDGGEIAHVVVNVDGPACPCGKKGCVEVLSSGPAIAAAYTAVSGRVLEVRAIAKAARAGDSVAENVWQNAATHLGLAIATYAQILDPEVVVVAGGVAAAGDQLLDPIRTAVQTQVSLPKPPQVVASRVAAGAGLAGAALIARQLLATRS